MFTQNPYAQIGVCSVNTLRSCLNSKLCAVMLIQRHRDRACACLVYAFLALRHLTSTKILRNAIESNSTQPKLSSSLGRLAYVNPISKPSFLVVFFSFFLFFFLSSFLSVSPLANLFPIIRKFSDYFISEIQHIKNHTILLTFSL